MRRISATIQFAGRPAFRIPAECNDEISLGNNGSRLILQLRRQAFDEIEQAFPTWRSIGAVLNVPGRPEVFGCAVVRRLNSVSKASSTSALCDSVVWSIRSPPKARCRQAGITPLFCSDLIP